MHALTWDDCELALAVARAGSASAAAQRLDVNQSTVSRRLAKLRSKFDTELFVRQGRALIPTEAGQILVHAAERMEATMLGADGHLAGLSKELSGRVAISVVPIIFEELLAEPLVRFMNTYPHVELDIECSNELRDLDRREADVLVRATHAPPPDWLGKSFGRLAYALYERRDGVGDATVAWPMRQDDFSTKAWFKQLPNMQRVRYRVGDPAAQQSLVRAGAGAALLPCLCGDADLALQRVAGAPIEHGREVWVLTHSRLRTSTRVSALRDVLHRSLSRRTSAIEGGLGPSNRKVPRSPS